MAKTKEKEQTFDQALARLQEILEGLQSEQIGVDDLAKQMKEAAELVQFCKKRLRDAELQVKEVMKGFEDTLQQDPDLLDDDSGADTEAAGSAIRTTPSPF